jgi:bacterioferritin-associated ferredoxin
VLPNLALGARLEEVPMIVCHCMVVNDRAVADATEQGARTLAQVCRATGAGRDCGTCVFSVRRLLCKHAPTSEPTYPEVQCAAS